MNASPTASKPSALTAADLKVDHVYSAERPRTIGGFDRLIDDRQIVWISDDSLRVQYDSPTVPFGRKYPIVDAERFLRWAGADVTNLMPENGDWRRA